MPFLIGALLALAGFLAIGLAVHNTQGHAFGILTR